MFYKSIPLLRKGALCGIIAKSIVCNGVVAILWRIYALELVRIWQRSLALHKGIALQTP
ncbi:hypothetical protein [Helicobacter sp.]|uniref:hypothetical protein n=1 Tax=Helicobacter sp. TaxID=218 RepID=UPI0025C35423|nr:hypothetical protein [Helicobacter sp.]MCI5632314.1 hypothetical protein [Helicobacter sp.]